MSQRAKVVYLTSDWAGRRLSHPKSSHLRLLISDAIISQDSDTQMSEFPRCYWMHRAVGSNHPLIHLYWEIQTQYFHQWDPSTYPQAQSLFFGRANHQDFQYLPERLSWSAIILAAKIGWEFTRISREIAKLGFSWKFLFFSNTAIGIECSLELIRYMRWITGSPLQSSCLWYDCRAACPATGLHRTMSSLHSGFDKRHHRYGRFSSEFQWLGFRQIYPPSLCGKGRLGATIRVRQRRQKGIGTRAWGVPERNTLIWNMSPTSGRSSGCHSKPGNEKSSSSHEAESTWR